jgi:hypothetical protein
MVTVNLVQLKPAAVIYSLDKTLLKAGKILDLPVSMGIPTE